MAQFSQALNTDLNGKLTSSVYDSNVAQWMQKVQNYVQTDAGVWVPAKGDASGRTRVLVENATDSPANVQLTGSKAQKATLKVTMPLSVAAGAHVPVADLVDLPKKGYKRITFGYKWEANIPHQVYVNHYNEVDVQVGNALIGQATSQYGTKETNTITNRVVVLVNNADTISRNLTDIEIWVWPN